MTVTQLEPAPDRALPVDLDAERSVLGGIMLSRDALRDVLDILRPEDFYRPAHEFVFQVAIDLDAAGEPVDAVTVATELQRRGQLTRAGGPSALHDLTAFVPTAANAGWYAGIVREQAGRRRLVEAGTRIAQLGYSPATTSEALDDAQGILGALADGWHAADGVTAAGDISAAVDEAMDALETGTEAWATGWSDLDRLTRGWAPGRLAVVAARPAVGKSAVALQTALHVALDLDMPVGYTSLEMTRAELLQRACSHVGRVDYGRLQRSPGEKLTDAEWRAVAKATGRLRQARLSIHDRPATVTQIRAQIRAAIRCWGQRPGLWVVDYLQLLTSLRRAENRQVEVATMTRELKLTAVELGVPILVAAQLNRGPATEKRAPRLADLRESGAIEQDADVVILLDRDDEAPDQLGLVVAKNRHGPTGGVALTWAGHYQTATERGWTPSGAIGGAR